MTAVEVGVRRFQQELIREKYGAFTFRLPERRICQGRPQEAPLVGTLEGSEVELFHAMLPHPDKYW